MHFKAPSKAAVITIAVVSLILFSAYAVTFFTQTAPTVLANGVTSFCKNITFLTANPNSVTMNTTGTIIFFCNVGPNPPNPAFTTRRANATATFNLPLGYVSLFAVPHFQAAPPSACSGVTGGFQLLNATFHVYPVARADWDYCANFSNPPTSAQLNAFNVTWTGSALP